MQNQNQTLAEKAVLIKLSVALPGQARKDQSITNEIQKDKHLGADAGRWIKTLWPEVALKPLKVLEGNIRSYHRQVTFPWDNDGTGILPAALWWEYTAKIDGFRAEFFALLDSHFLARFDEWVSWAKTQHNGTFDASLYDKGKVRDSFRLDVRPLPVPASDHFTGTIGSIIGTSAAEVDARIADVTLDTRKELFERVIVPLSKMATSLADPDKIFRDTLVENMRDIVRLVPALNLTGDANLAASVAEIEAKLVIHSPDVLRENKEVRRDVAAEAAEILSRLQGYV